MLLFAHLVFPEEVLLRETLFNGTLSLVDCDQETINFAGWVSKFEKEL